jgi:aminoglycoside/choline kinase family phosphotransferase
MTAPCPSPAPPDHQTAQAVLEEGLRAHFGRPLRVACLERLPLTTSSHDIDRLRVTLGSGERLSVIFKRLRPRHKLYGNEREVLVYRRLLPGGGLGGPALYASAYDEAAGRYWLFLEDVGNASLKGATTDAWYAAARWLGELHAAYWGREEELLALGCLGEHGPNYYHCQAETAREFLRLGGVPGAVARFDALMAGFDEVVAELARQPRTLIHGDVFTENLMVQPGPRVRAIDWESAAVGLPAWDLAHLLDGWEEQHRGKVLAEYLAGFACRSAVPLDREALARSLELCELLNLLRHLGWEVEACASPGFVEGGLAEMGAFWERREARHG